MELEFLLRRNKDLDKKEDVEWEPAAIMNCAYADTQCTRVYCTADDKFKGYIYLVDFNKDRPIEAL
jgi:hypothetical protein